MLFFLAFLKDPAKAALKYGLGAYLIGKKKQSTLSDKILLIFPATEICVELCYQSTRGHLPPRSASFET